MCDDLGAIGGHQDSMDSQVAESGEDSRASHAGLQSALPIQIFFVTMATWLTNPFGRVGATGRIFFG
jgi:hypothetical protein